MSQLNKGRAAPPWLRLWLTVRENNCGLCFIPTTVKLKPAGQFLRSDAANG